MLQTLAQNRPLAESLEALAGLAQTEVPGSAACILLVSADGSALEFAAGVELPEPLRPLCQSLVWADTDDANPQTSSVREPVFSASLAGDPYWHALDGAAREAGLRSCWTFPILDGSGTLLGLLSVFQRPLPRLSAADSNPLAEVASLAGIAIERYRNRIDLQRRMELETLVRDISLQLLCLPEAATDDGIRHVLARLGSFIAADRCYLMQHSADGDTIDNTHEWCAAGVAPQIDDLQQLPTNELRNWLDLLEEQQLLIVHQRTEMPPNPRWARIFDDGRIESVLFVPMMHHGVLIGLLGFDAVRAPRRWEDNVITLVQLVADLLVGAIIRRQLVAALRHDAERDPLTGLANRRRIQQTLRAEALRLDRDGGTLALVMFDIDHFQRINANYGYDAGNDVLRMLAGVVDRHCRRTDRAARWDGERFLVLLPQTDLDQAMLVAERLRQEVAAAVFPVPEPLSISLGVASVREGQTLAQAVRAAEDALALAKRSGRNFVATVA
ncbi:MAG: sensor domain-containing diguanylate cyclase [Pigmentiphaga sp.]|nr:sensor domain-containing diguanylate cyclase [Pigmentiphaga sp.]